MDELRSFYGFYAGYNITLPNLLLLNGCFPTPSYPDGDPLLVRIDFSDELPTDCDPFLLLDEIDPTPVMYELNPFLTHMFMMRIRGVDTVPDS